MPCAEISMAASSRFEREVALKLLHTNKEASIISALLECIVPTIYLVVKSLLEGILKYFG